MLAAHRSFAVFVLGAGVIFTASAFATARREGSRVWLEWAWKTLMFLVALETLAGMILYGGGHRPQESLHLLYGGLALLVLPFGSYFAAEAPPRPRAVVLGGAGLLTVGVLFRAFATG